MVKYSNQTWTCGDRNRRTTEMAKMRTSQTLSWVKKRQVCEKIYVKGEAGNRILRPVQA